MERRRLRDYRSIMADEVRMRAYDRAIRSTCAGKVVCEIGVGLGPLSVMALRAGAVRVYGIEVDPDCLAVTAEIIRTSGLDPARFIPLLGLSNEVSLPERVAVILSETLDSIGVGENTRFYMKDAQARFLKPGGRFIPAALKCYLALARPRAQAAEQQFWSVDLMERYGLDYAAVASLSSANMQAGRLEQDELYSAWRIWQDIDFLHDRGEGPPGRALVPVARAGTITGLAFAFEATLCPGVSLRTLPSDPPTHWRQGFLAFPDGPVKAAAGDSIYVELPLTEEGLPVTRLEPRIVHVPAGELAALPVEIAALASAETVA
jgi:hypothetical protein